MRLDGNAAMFYCACVILVTASAKQCVNIKKNHTTMQSYSAPDRFLIFSVQRCSNKCCGVCITQVFEDISDIESWEFENHKMKLGLVVCRFLSRHDAG